MFAEEDEKSIYPKKRPDNWKAILDAYIVKGFPATPYADTPYDFIEFKLADHTHVKTFGHIMREVHNSSSPPPPSDFAFNLETQLPLSLSFTDGDHTFGYSWRN